MAEAQRVRLGFHDPQLAPFSRRRAFADGDLFRGGHPNQAAIRGEKGQGARFGTRRLIGGNDDLAGGRLDETVGARLARDLRGKRVPTGLLELRERLLRSQGDALAPTAGVSRWGGKTENG